MSIKNQLTDDVKTAMKARDQFKLDTLRYVLSRIKNVEIDKGELDDTAVQQIISKVLKETNESITEYKKGQRSDLAESEQNKAAVLEAYLPKPLSDTELRQLIAETIQEKPDHAFGQLIGAVNAKAAGRADGGRIAALIKEIVAK